MIQLPLPITIVTGFLARVRRLCCRTCSGRRRNGVSPLWSTSLAKRQSTARCYVMIHLATEYRCKTLRTACLLMAQLHARRALIDHVVIETSGLAAPSAVMERLQSDDVLAERFVLDASLAI